MKQAGLACRVLPPDEPPNEHGAVDESPLSGEPPTAYVERVSRAKAEHGYTRLRADPEIGYPCLLLAADTTVVQAGNILGKPRDAADAARMLRALAGRTHRVLSGVVLRLCTARGDFQERYRLNQTRVRFRTLTSSEINAYIASGEPFDKAGAYGIQGAAGAFVARLCGSYTGVMGLPIYELGLLYRELGLSDLKR